MPRLSRLTRLGLVYYVVLITALVVGCVVGGGIGTTVAAIAAISLALTILAANGGLGLAARDGVESGGRSYGGPLDDEEEDLGS